MSEHTPADEPDTLTADEREDLGERLMLAMTCNHGADYFGPGAVCETCFTNVQRIGRIVERILAARAADHRHDDLAARVEALADEWERDEAYACRNAAECVRCVSFQRAVIRLRALLPDAPDEGGAR